MAPPEMLCPATRPAGLLLAVVYALLAIVLAGVPRPAPAVGWSAIGRPSRRDAPRRAAARGAFRLRFGGRLPGPLPKIRRSVWRGQPPGEPEPRSPSRKRSGPLAWVIPSQKYSGRRSRSYEERRSSARATNPGRAITPELAASCGVASSSLLTSY